MKVIFPVAGLGTRLFPFTKEQPKEMLPLFSKSSKGQVFVKPLIQIIFEQFYQNGFREFCFIVGRNKRIIEDHFTSDATFLEKLKKTKKSNHKDRFEFFFNSINNSSITWVNQSQALGFGHAVSRVESFIGDNQFLLHAGDTLIISEKNTHVKTLIDLHKKNEADVSFYVQEVQDPSIYGVVEGKIESEVIEVKNLQEKPSNPKTNLAIMPIYIFRPIIFDFLKKVKPDKNREIQLTDAINDMVKEGMKVIAVNATKSVTWLDIGNPDSYWNALNVSHEQSLKI